MKQSATNGRIIRFDRVVTLREQQRQKAQLIIRSFMDKEPEGEIERVLHALCILLLEDSDYDKDWCRD